MPQKNETPSRLPVSYKDFIKEPVKATLFMCIIAISYLYMDQRINYNRQIENQGEKIEKLENKVDKLTENLRKSDSTLSAAIEKIKVLKELGQIK